MIGTMTPEEMIRIALSTPSVPTGPAPRPTDVGVVDASAAYKILKEVDQPGVSSSWVRTEAGFSAPPHVARYLMTEIDAEQETGIPMGDASATQLLAVMMLDSVRLRWRRIGDRPHITRTSIGNQPSLRDFLIGAALIAVVFVISAAGHAVLGGWFSVLWGGMRQ